MSSRNLLIAITIILLLGLGTWWFNSLTSSANWSADEVKILQSLSIRSLPPLPINTSNAVADNPKAAEFGRQLFFDERFSHNAKISCATCHKPDLHFTDGLKTAAGAQAGIRNTPTLVGVAYSPWQFWDGRKDSIWSQALAPLENALEHAATRTQFAHIIFDDKNYRTQYEQLFGQMPNLSDKNRFPKAAGPVINEDANNAWLAMATEDQDAVNRVFVNIAKSVAAYQRLLLPDASRFDDYIEGIVTEDTEKLKLLNRNEIAGLQLFIGKAQCMNCHNGPLFTNNEFHNTGILSAARQLPSMGRVSGVRAALADPFNCLGEYSDAESEQCADLHFAKLGDELIGAHKVPTLRNVAATAPYMHAGQLDTLEAVISHYNQAPLSMIGHNEIKPLKLNSKEKKQLIQFLHTLSGPLVTDSKWLISPHI